MRRTASLPCHCEKRRDEAIHTSFGCSMDCFASLAMTVEGLLSNRHFFTLLASILIDASSILVENALFTSNGFSMPR